jgi:hypothetical protein
MLNYWVYAHFKVVFAYPAKSQRVDGRLSSLIGAERPDVPSGDVEGFIEFRGWNLGSFDALVEHDKSFGNLLCDFGDGDLYFMGDY